MQSPLPFLGEQAEPCMGGGIKALQYWGDVSIQCYLNVN